MSISSLSRSIFLSILFTFLFLTIPALAADPVSTNTPDTLGKMISDLYIKSISVVGVILFVVITYAGFLRLTAFGSPGRASEGNKKIQNAVMGAVLLLAAYIILRTINPALVGEVGSPSGVLPPLPPPKSGTK